MNILITGGAGFIGSNLADKLLSLNHNITVIDNFNDYYDIKLKERNIQHNLSNSNYKLYRTDICNYDEMDAIFKNNKFDCIIHLAARAGVRPSIEKPLDYIETNIKGTAIILELMKKYNLHKLVSASSSSVYGNCTAEKFSETLNIHEPISPYAATKSSNEEFIYLYSKLYDINAICLRFFTVYGPRQRPDLAINKFIHLIKSNKPIQMFGDGSTMRDYTYIDDIVSGIISSINYNKTPFEIINLGGGHPILLKDMIKIIEKTLNKTAIIEQKPMQAGDVNKTVSDITKAQKLLGYNPETSFEIGISNFIKWIETNETK